MIAFSVNRLWITYESLPSRINRSFLQYWPVIPLYRIHAPPLISITTPNGGTFVESMKQLDGWIGEILDEMDNLGIAENTLVVAHGRQRSLHQILAGQWLHADDLSRRQGRCTTEGGVRVDAFARWPGMIEKDSIVGDIVHVADLFTSIARFCGATDKIPTDRVIDGGGPDRSYAGGRNPRPSRPCLHLLRAIT